MTQVCSLTSSTAGTDNTHNEKRLPKGIHIIGAENNSAPKVGGMPGKEEEPNKTKAQKKGEDTTPPWGYIFIQHMAAGVFEKRLESINTKGAFKPRCFIHRTIRYKQKPGGKGVIKEQVPSVSGLVFLQGTTQQLKLFLMQNFPQYYLVNNCSTGLPASIPDSVMQPFMDVMDKQPERITFLRDPFMKFAQEHIKLRILTGLFAGLEGYVVRVNRDRQLVMNFGGYAVAISNVHNEDFELAE